MPSARGGGRRDRAGPLLARPARRLRRHPAEQREAFAWHIDLAKRTGKPLMIHNRDADADVLDVLRAEGAPQTVIFHCFSSDAEMARTCVDAGWVLSLSGTVSFRNARALHEAAALIPAGQLLVETDAPFLTPHPYRGAPNEPYCLPYTVRALADIVDRPAADLARETAATASRVYGFAVNVAVNGAGVAVARPVRYRLVINVGRHRTRPESESGITTDFECIRQASPVALAASACARFVATLLALDVRRRLRRRGPQDRDADRRRHRMTVATMKSRVIDVVKENGFDVGDRDDLYPAGDQPVHQSDAIVLRRSRPLQISTGRPGQPAGVDHGVDGRRGAGPAGDDRHGARGGVSRQPACRWAACRCPW